MLSRKGSLFYCPNGHRQYYTETEAQKLRRERDRLQQQLAQRDDELKQAQQDTIKVHQKMRKLEKRTAAGVCPCCSRTVGQLARHIKTQHPEYAKEHLGESGTLPDENKIIPMRRRRKRA